MEISRATSMVQLHLIIGIFWWQLPGAISPWIIGLLASKGSSSYVPEPVRITFHSFLDIKNPETFEAPDESLLQAGYKALVDSKFNLTEWWKIAEGEKLSKPFDIGEELVAGLLHVLEMALNQSGPQRLAGAELRT
ncbi:hypothetical protein F5888DRAFT_1639367 [Russula emetica]|nr:hypothetical protein F5888DRAFT_1639367 [Russula emetica]